MTHSDMAAIPPDLREQDNWVVWQWITRDGKSTKPPIDIKTGSPGDATNPALWMSFEQARVEMTHYDGIGFAIGGTAFTGIDLDKCVSEDGVISGWAVAIVDRLNSYTERTPSGKGLRVWVKGKLPEGRRRKGNIEMYDGGRYFTVTGDHVEGTPTAIVERTVELANLHAEIFQTAPAKPAPVKQVAPADLSDTQLLDRMFAAKNGKTIEALFYGDASRYSSESEADLALCSHLAFWGQNDPETIDRLFRLSGLCDSKWLDRPDYRAKTIAKATEGGRCYDPKHNGGGNGYGLKIRAKGGDNPPPPLEGQDDDGDGGEQPTEAPDDPHRLARLYYEVNHAHPETPTLRFWDEEWHQWDGQAWRVIPEQEIKADLVHSIKAEFNRIAIEAGQTVKPVTTKALSNAIQALRDIALLSLRRCPRQPAWIGPREAGEDLPNTAAILPASNALIHLPSLVAGEPARLSPTPRFFSPSNLGYEFDPDAGRPVEWLAFLGDLWPDDPDSIEALQEWFGYFLVPDTSLQKILMLIGPKRSGKGTICRILRSLIGSGNVASPTLSGLAMNFGLAPLIGKTLALIADARLSGRADSQVIVERLLSISGEDAQTIDRKHLTSWHGTLPTRFALVSNELPRLGDSSGALAGRMIVLRLTRSFYGHEDASLTARLVGERTAILLWAIEGWRRLRDRGRFHQPASGQELMEDMEELSSPIGAFVAERCEVGPDESVSIGDAYEAWKAFCLARGKSHPGDEQGFGRNLRSVVPSLKTVRRGSDGSRVREYEGVSIKRNFR